MKGKCIAVIQKQIIMEIIIWWRETTKLWHISAKTLVEWFWWVLARVRPAELRWISKPAQEFFNYIKSSCMIFSAKMSGYSQIVYWLQGQSAKYGAKIFELYQVLVCQNVLILPYCILLTRIKSIYSTSQ